MENIGKESWGNGSMVILGEGGSVLRAGDETYFFLFITLFAQILAPSGHLSAAHGMFFGREVLFDLGFCRN